MPYVSATQSGIVQIAYGFEKPVVVTNVGGLPDVVWDKETGYVVPSRSPEAIAKAIIGFYREDSSVDWQANIRAKAQEFSWETMVDRIEECLNSCK